MSRPTALTLRIELHHAAQSASGEMAPKTVDSKPHLEPARPQARMPENDLVGAILLNPAALDRVRRFVELSDFSEEINAVRLLKAKLGYQH